MTNRLSLLRLITSNCGFVSRTSEECYEPCHSMLLGAACPHSAPHFFLARQPLRVCVTAYSSTRSTRRYTLCDHLMWILVFFWLAGHLSFALNMEQMWMLVFFC
jgi:hypothetical protein